MYARVLRDLVYKASAMADGVVSIYCDKAILYRVSINGGSMVNMSSDDENEVIPWALFHESQNKTQNSHAA